MLELNDLLQKEGLDPNGVLALRHRPTEPELRKVLPWLAQHRPDIFNAYQATQNPRAEAAMGKATHVASFIGHVPGKAAFVGLYRQLGGRMHTSTELRELEVYKELGRYAGEGDAAFTQSAGVLFNLELTDALADWQGRLIVRWPPPELSWFRWCGNAHLTVEAITEEGVFAETIPDPQDLNLSWAQLSILPPAWRAALRQWRGIYFIFDTERKAGYVGSASGGENLFGRWSDYASTGHGGNRRLRESKPENLRFSILQLTAPDLDRAAVRALEDRWKDRLHTRGYQLNEPTG